MEGAASTARRCRVPPLVAKEAGLVFGIGRCRGTQMAGEASCSRHGKDSQSTVARLWGIVGGFRRRFILRLTDVYA